MVINKAHVDEHRHVQHKKTTTKTQTRPAQKKTQKRPAQKKTKKTQTRPAQKIKKAQTRPAQKKLKHRPAQLKGKVFFTSILKNKYSYKIKKKYDINLLAPKNA